MFQNAKIQDLNVIHNSLSLSASGMYVVSECKDTRFECNSQPHPAYCVVRQVVSECKDTRFECNSQPECLDFVETHGCFRMQRYKIWM